MLVQWMSAAGLRSSDLVWLVLVKMEQLMIPIAVGFIGATVITNLVSTIPIVGTKLVWWVWGGHDVCRGFFFTLHFLLTHPFIQVTNQDYWLYYFHKFHYVLSVGAVLGILCGVTLWSPVLLALAILLVSIAVDVQAWGFQFPFIHSCIHLQFQIHKRINPSRYIESYIHTNNIYNNYIYIAYIILCV